MWEWNLGEKWEWITAFRLDPINGQDLKININFKLPFSFFPFKNLISLSSLLLLPEYVVYFLPSPTAHLSWNLPLSKKFMESNTTSKEG